MIDKVTELPFNRFIGLQVCADSGEGLLELPAGEHYLNHIGTVHAAVQLALAEACSGEYLLRSLKKLRADQSTPAPTNFIPVVRRVESKFRKPAQGRIVGKLNSSLTSIDGALSELLVKGRCLLTIHIDIFDQQAQHTLSSSFDWFVAAQDH